MERTITAILTNSNSKKVFTSNATTLKELKAEMDAQGIDYKNMDFMEGLTHTTMIDDNAILPSNVKYKDKVTNNLVFMLSTTNKNIRSGAMSRKECYEYIKNNNLKEEANNFAKKIHGTYANYTNVTTITLVNFIESHTKKNAVPSDRKGLYTFIKENNIGEFIKSHCGKNYTTVDTLSLHAACLLWAKHNTLSQKTAAPKQKETKSPYSDKELDDIIKGLRS